MKLTYCLWAILYAQTHKKFAITGIVHNAETGKPLPRAVGHMHRADITLTTNELGRFAFTIAILPDTIDVTMVGYSVEHVPVITITLMSILLEETSRSLDSVLVSKGYQRMPKERATGSFGNVGNALLNRRVSASVLTRIENITPCVLFSKGDAPNTDALLIRGHSTIFANAALLNTINNFPYDKLLIAKRDGAMSVAEADVLIEGYKQYDAKDTGNYLYHNGINRQHALNVNGNTANINYYFSAGWDKNRLVLAGVGNHRITPCTPHTFCINSILQADTGINFIRVTGKQGNNPGYSLNSGYGKSRYPYARLVDENSEPMVLVKDNRLAFTECAANTSLLNWQYNPINDIAGNELSTSNKDYVPNTALRYSIIPGLEAEARYQYEQASPALCIAAILPSINLYLFYR